MEDNTQIHWLTHEKKLIRRREHLLKRLSGGNFTEERKVKLMKELGEIREFLEIK